MAHATNTQEMLLQNQKDFGDMTRHACMSEVTTDPMEPYPDDVQKYMKCVCIQRKNQEEKCNE